MKKILLFLLLLPVLAFGQGTQNFAKGIIGVQAKRVFGGSLPSNISSSTTGSTTISYTTGRPVISGGSGNVTTKTEAWTWSGGDDYITSDLLNQILIFKPVSSGLGFGLIWDTNVEVRVNLNSTASLSTATLVVGGSDVATTPALTGWSYNSNLLYCRLTYNKFTTTYSIEFGVYTNNLNDYYVSANYVSATNTNGAAHKLSFYGGSYELYESYINDRTSISNTLTYISDSRGWGTGANTPVYTNAFFYQLQNGTRHNIEQIAHPGATLSSAVSWIPLIQRTNSEYYVIDIGVNSIDAETVTSFMVKYNQIIAACRANGAKVFCISITPNNKTNYANTPSYNSAIQAVCDGVNVIYADNYTAMNDGTGHFSSTYSGDGLHFDQTGHDWMRDFLKAIFKQYFII